MCSHGVERWRLQSFVYCTSIVGYISERYLQSTYCVAIQFYVSILCLNTCSQALSLCIFTCYPLVWGTRWTLDSGSEQFPDVSSIFCHFHSVTSCFYIANKCWSLWNHSFRKSQVPFHSSHRPSQQQHANECRLSDHDVESI